VNEKNQKEIRFKFGNKILGYIDRFSATEKVVFGIVVGVFIISGIILAIKASHLFMVDIPKDGGTLNEGVLGLPRLINPIIATSEVDKDISSLIFSGLTKYVEGNIVSDIARDWSVSEDGLVYVFKLRKGVVFHDGTPLTADDVVYTIQKIQDPTAKSPKRADWSGVTVRKINELEVEFTLKQAYAPFINNTTVGIIPKHIWSNVSNEELIFSEYNMKPIGSGPMKYSSVTMDKGGIPTRYMISRFSDFYNKKTYLDSIVFYFYDNETNMIQDLEGGTIDSVSNLSPETKKILTDNEADVDYKEALLPRIFGVFFNSSQSTLLSDIDVRKSLSLAVDKKSIINNVFLGDAFIANGPIPFTNSVTPNDISTSTNIDQAKKILEKSGWKLNENNIYEKKIKNINQELAFTLYTSDAYQLKMVANILVAQWEKIGAKVSIKVYEENELYNNVIRTRKYDALLFGEQIGRGDDIYAFWHSSQRNAPGLNITMYANNKVDKILESLRSETLEVNKQKLYNDLNTLILNDVPAIFIYSPKYIYAVSKSINNVSINKLSIPSDRFNKVDSWYQKTEKVLKVFSK
jgi:peptide/nickel transport system substrate-binding protein